MPDIVRVTIKGNENVGLFATVWDDLLIIPPETKPTTISILKETLQIEDVEQTTVAETSLLGMFIVMNKSGIVLPHTITPQELAFFNSLGKQYGRNVSVVSDTITAMGNTILATDKRAIVSPNFSKEAIEIIAETLDVEAVPELLVSSPLVGSVAYSTSKGTLLHPLATREDIRFIERELGTQVDITTVNRGVPYPHSGIIATTKGAAVGSSTTGPETLRIYQVLF